MEKLFPIDVDDLYKFLRRIWVSYIQHNKKE